MSNLNEQIMELVRANTDKLILKDIARRLGIKGDDRRALRVTAREMVENGVLILSSRKTYREAGELPNVMVIRVIEIDTHGDMIGVPDNWKSDGPAPQMIVIEGPISKKSKGHSSAQLGMGSRALCRIKRPCGSAHTCL